ncbi:MAG: hypothetical protein ACI9PZ_002119, partial [Parvicella sp.]
HPSRIVKKQRPLRANVGHATIRRVRIKLASS